MKKVVLAMTGLSLWANAMLCGIKFGVILATVFYQTVHDGLCLGKGKTANSTPLATGRRIAIPEPITPVQTSLTPG